MKRTRLPVPAAVMILVSVMTYNLDASPELVFARMTALGGTHIALAPDIGTLYANPAGFLIAEPEVVLSALTVGGTGPLFDIVSVVLGTSGGISEEAVMSPALSDVLQGLRSGAEVIGPLFIGYVGDGIAFALHNRLFGRAAQSSPLGVTLTIGGELAALWGMSWRFPLPEDSRWTLDAGAAVKVFVRGESVTEKSYLQLPSLLSGSIESALREQPFIFSTGAGIDLGLLLGHDREVSFGLTVRDVLSAIGENRYERLDTFLEGGEPPSRSESGTPWSLDAGMAYTPKLGGFHRFVDTVTIMADYTDVFDFLTVPSDADNPVLNLGFGIEIRLLGILYLRSGFTEGLPSAGFGIDMPRMSISGSMYGTEASGEPGTDPTFNARVSLSFTR